MPEKPKCQRCQKADKIQENTKCHKVENSQKRHKNQNCQKFQRTPKTKNAKFLKKPEIEEATVPTMTHKLKKNPEKPKRP